MRRILYYCAPLLSLCACGEPAQQEPAQSAPNAAGGAQPAITASPELAPELPEQPGAESLYALSALSLEGEELPLARFHGQVSLVVNVASRCGYTPQYGGLQDLHYELSERGFAVLGFPSNDFGAQEPGSAEEIRDFCTQRYGIDFPLFAKVVTREGDGQSPVYARLQTLAGELPSWNFGKYLVSRDGARVQFFGPDVEPSDPQLRAAIFELLEG